ncbi:hypothetical protein [Mesorhizobium sp.]|uniref:hypothetical protein n=1 Tax=Mesorhizobium sp. TaxID=1871066 RepID=UPI001200975C|nr:hypothetical protein [Mesorhizobium sp.]TIT02565.1 MAG: hypothetical protein E5W87_09720 [Mesorhizobium sp.]
MSADVAHRIFPSLNFIVSSFCVTEKHLFIWDADKVRILHRVTPNPSGASMSWCRASFVSAARHLLGATGKATTTRLAALRLKRLSCA